MIKNISSFFAKQNLLKKQLSAFTFSSSSQKKCDSIHLSPDRSQFQQIPTEQLVKNLMINAQFRHQADQVKIYELPQKKVADNEQNTSNCFQHIHIPISCQKDIQDGLIRFDKKSIRIGKLMELFDLIAGEISYKYLGNNFKDATCVTACVDNIKFLDLISPYKDIHIQAYPCYVGNSSIEVQIDLYQKENDQNPDCPLELKTTSAFLMVARQAYDRSKAYQLPKLQIESQIESQLYNQGVLRQQYRKQKKDESLYKIAPTAEQMTHIHKFFVNEDKYRNNSEQFKSINKTQLTKVLPMHFQDKNIHGNIFGGFIIREAFELGYLSGIMLNKGKVPLIKYIDDFQFIQPVHIGDILKFESQVCCVKDNQAFVNVECKRMGYDNQPIEKTNELQLIFEVDNNAQQVYPLTYASAMKYLYGYNFIKKQSQQC